MKLMAHNSWERVRQELDMDVMSVHFRNRLVVLSNLIMGTGIMGATPKKTASHFITVTKIVSVNEIKLRNQHCA